MTDHRLHKCIFFALCSIMFVACSSGPDGPTPIINDITDSDSDGMTLMMTRLQMTWTTAQRLQIPCKKILMVIVWEMPAIPR